APRRYLLDGAAAPVAVGVGREAGRIFAALAGVAFAAQPVHRDRKVFMRFFADRPEGHRAGLEALDDFTGRLDLLDRYRVVSMLELEQAAQRGAAGRDFVNLAGVVLEQPVAARAHRMLELGDGIGVV